MKQGKDPFRFYSKRVKRNESIPSGWVVGRNRSKCSCGSFIVALRNGHEKRRCDDCGSPNPKLMIGTPDGQ